MHKCDEVKARSRSLYELVRRRYELQLCTSCSLSKKMPLIEKKVPLIELIMCRKASVKAYYIAHKEPQLMKAWKRMPLIGITIILPTRRKRKPQLKLIILPTRRKRMQLTGLIIVRKEECG